MSNIADEMLDDMPLFKPKQKIIGRTTPKMSKKIKVTNARDSKPVKVSRGQSMTKDQQKQTIKFHKSEIKRIKAQVKKHKLLIKQAKLAYKISK